MRTPASLAAAAAAAATLLAPALPAAAAASLLVNGSFEDGPAVAVNTWDIRPSVPGWTGDPTDLGGIERRNAYDGHALDGVNFVELDTYRNSWMTQTVATTAGTHYTLSWYYSPRMGVGSSNGTNQITVSWNGVQVWLNDGDGSNLRDNDWQFFSVDVLGTGGLDEVRFAAAGLSDQYGGSLDSISLTQTGEVPAPASLALVLAALPLLRRRR